MPDSKFVKKDFEQFYQERDNRISVKINEKDDSENESNKEMMPEIAEIKNESGDLPKI